MNLVLHAYDPSVRRRLLWVLPVLTLTLFVRAWLAWGVIAAAIFAPGAALLGIVIGLVIVRRRRRVR